MVQGEVGGKGGDDLQGIFLCDVYSLKSYIVRKMVTICRSNPPAMAGLPILRAATGGRPYNTLFGTGHGSLGFPAS